MLEIILCMATALVVLSVFGFFIYKEHKYIERKARRLKNTKLIDYIDHYLIEINKCQSLIGIFNLHKDMWTVGVQHKNFGPCEHGMFRTNDISIMAPNEVYLGNVKGYHTLTLPNWEKRSEEDKKVVIKQYKSHLISNLLDLRMKLITELYS